jgi:Protein of unknown function (DUF3830)
MHTLRIVAGPFTFKAQMEDEFAPVTCAAFRSILPFRTKIIHARWSGEACWIPLDNPHSQSAMAVPDQRRDENAKWIIPGTSDTTLAFENHTSHPGPGQILFYPGGYSVPEILFPYGSASFASKMGGLAGNHFLTVTEGTEQFRIFGRKVLWEGAHDILFELLD